MLFLFDIMQPNLNPASPNAFENVWVINKLLYKQLENLKEISRKNIPILVTNQVYFNIDKKKINLVGGEILKNNSGCLIELEKKSKKRKVIVRKPFEKEIMFEIKDGELI